MNQTLQLLRIISSPFEKASVPPTNNRQLLDLYRYSIKNRMSFFFLEALKTSNRITPLESVYEREYKKYLITVDAIARISLLLAEKNIEHAIFKTIRPYKSTTVDIDILIFGNIDNYKRSVKVMREAGYSLVTEGPNSTTLWDGKANIGIDLYNQVAVSFIIYIDKEKLTSYVISMKLLNGESIKTLKPEADLACVIAHSVIKEQMYTLAEYFTFMHYLKQLNINDFLYVVKQSNITTAVMTHASITALLHKAAHNTIPDKLQQILNAVGEKNLETTRLIKNNFETPHKYHLITVAETFLETAKTKKNRNSMAMQIYHMLNPNFTKKILKRLLQHMKRETY